MVKEFTVNDFDNTTLKHNGLVVVDFYADWCFPCKMLSAVLVDIADELDDVTFAKINIDENLNVASVFNIASIPAMYVFNDGEVVSRLVGYHDKTQIIDALDAWR
jgi:thioredoxin 1